MISDSFALVFFFVRKLVVSRLPLFPIPCCWRAFGFQGGGWDQRREASKKAAEHRGEKNRLKQAFTFTRLGGRSDGRGDVGTDGIKFVLAAFFRSGCRCCYCVFRHRFFLVFSPSPVVWTHDPFPYRRFRHSGTQKRALHIDIPIFSFSTIRSLRCKSWSSMNLSPVYTVKSFILGIILFFVL